MAYLIGIDIGTSGTKTILFDENGNSIASSVYEYSLFQPKPGWAEQEPEDWWYAVKTTIKEVLSDSQVKPADIKGIGLSGQMHGAVLLDENNNVLRPSIIWCDQRSSVQCEYIEEKIGQKRLIELTCNPALTGFTAPKLLWVKDHEPEIYDRVKKVLLPKDYIRFRLTGTFASEVSDASGTLLFDVKNRKWSREVLDELEISTDVLPEVFESFEVSGEVSKEVAGDTGLLQGTKVVGGGGDQAAGAVGNGIVETGIISSTIGSSGVVFAFTDEVKMDPLGRVHTFCHAVPDKWHVMGVTQGAGLSLKWFRDNFAQMEKYVGQLSGVSPYVFLDQEAAKAPVGAEGLIFLPYLMGERTPHLDPNARAVFFGITGRHTRSDMIRAVMEGVVYSLRDSFEILRDMNVPIKQVRASGGGAKSLLWRKMQADIFGADIVTINVSEGPAFGVALLAGVGTGVYSSVEEACKATIKIKNEQIPDKDGMKLYDKYYGVYTSLYDKLKDDFNKVSEIVEQYT